MKFLCDRCKTRYSIGEDRVRGKILKIRCKNCSNVITVREGMPEPVGPAEAAESSRRSKPTTMAPIAGESLPKPPSSLEEEWYVSIDGEQSGPYSLQAAQQWVSSKAPDADLHCWSEGFDDWLPVDKVSHFRGLRTKPQAPAVGRAPSGQQRPLTAVPPPVPEEAKPLFAATMAAVEKAVDERSAPNAFGGPTVQTPNAFGGVTEPGAFANTRTVTTAAGAPAFRATGSGTGPTPLLATTRGTGPVNGHAPPRAGTAPLPTMDAPTPSAMPKAPSAPVAMPAPPSAPVAVPPTPSAVMAAAPPTTVMPTPPSMTPAPMAAMRGPSTGPAMGVPGFDLGGGSSTEVEAPPFPAFGSNGSHAAPPPPVVESDDGDDDLDIGEVSRVVNLADLAKQARAKAERKSQPIAVVAGRAATVPGNGTGPLPRLSQPRLGTAPVVAQNGTHPFAAIAATDGAALDGGAALDPTAGDPNASLVAAAPQQPVSHKRGMIALLVGALLLLGAAIAVVLVVMNSHHDVVGGDQLGGGNEIDTTRPDDPIRNHVVIATNPGSGSGSADVQNPLIPKNPNNGGGTVRHNNGNGGQNGSTGSTGSTGPAEIDRDSLGSDEIEAMAKKYSTNTQRCYMRAQRGADAITIGDVKKVVVTLSIEKAGGVSSVTLNEHGDDTLGKCLITAIKAWQFRPSPGGTYKFSLVFSN